MNADEQINLLHFTINKGQTKSLQKPCLKRTTAMNSAVTKYLQAIPNQPLPWTQ